MTSTHSVGKRRVQSVDARGYQGRNGGRSWDDASANERPFWQTLDGQGKITSAELALIVLVIGRF